MKKIDPTSLYLVMAIMTAAFVSCKKTNDRTNIVTNSPTAAAFFNSKQPAAQVFNFNTIDLPRSFTLNDGSIISIPAGAFTVGGVAVSGQAVLEATAFSKKGNMMLACLNTTSNG